MDKIEINRRLLLQVLAAGGASALLDPRTAYAQSECPTPPSGQLPDFARLVEFLVNSKSNRITFSKDADGTFNQYKICDEDRAAFFTFNPNEILLRIQKEMPSNAPDDLWSQLIDLIAQSKAWWKDWPNNPDGPYPNQQFTCPADSAQYNYPAFRVYDIAEHNKVGNQNEVTVLVQGALKECSLKFEHDPANSAKDVGPITAELLPGSTFRCGKVKVKADLQEGDDYLIVLSNTRPQKTSADKKRIKAK